MTTRAPITTLPSMTVNKLYRLGWLLVVFAGATRAPAQAPPPGDSAIILTRPARTRALRCSTSVAPGVVELGLVIQAGPFADTRRAIGTFDTTGRALTLRDVAFRVGHIEAVAVQFDPAGVAHGGVGQSLAAEEFTKDSTGALHPRHPAAFLPLTRAQLATAESASAWLWATCHPSESP